MILPRIFGCVIFVHLHKNQHAKVDPCMIWILFLGYDYTKKSYRCYDIVAKWAYVTIDVTLFESDTYYSPLLSNSFLQGEMQDKQLSWLIFEWPSFRDTKISVNEDTLTRLNVFSDDDIAPRVEGTLPKTIIEFPLS